MWRIDSKRARGKRNDTARFGERNEKKTDKARENSVSPWFLHVFGIFVHLKRTHKHVSEMKTEKRRFVYRLIQMPNDVCNESRPKQGEAEQ